jgi:hypothetical protein
MVYGALVTKTNRIARILEGTKKIITKKPRFMSASSQVIITCILVGIATSTKLQEYAIKIPIIMIYISSLVDALTTGVL